jgi:hypothetical protein
MAKNRNRYKNNNTKPTQTQSQIPEKSTVELGWGGVKILGGVVQDEHNHLLTGKQAIQTAEKMRRTDAQVRAVEKIISLPIRSTVWWVDAPDNASEAEKEAAEILNKNLFGGMQTSFDDLLREGCLAIYFGFRTPEIVWKEQDGC